jgi:hypothetical protein
VLGGRKRGTARREGADDHSRAPDLKLEHLCLPPPSAPSGAPYVARP